MSSCVPPQPLYLLASPSSARLIGRVLHLPSPLLHALHPVVHSHCLTRAPITSRMFTLRIVRCCWIRYAVTSLRIVFAPSYAITAPHALIRAPRGFVIPRASTPPFARHSNTLRASSLFVHRLHPANILFAPYASYLPHAPMYVPHRPLHSSCMISASYAPFMYYYAVRTVSAPHTLCSPFAHCVHPSRAVSTLRTNLYPHYLLALNLIRHYKLRYILLVACISSNHYL
jgi:hypothetical protein